MKKETNTKKHITNLVVGAAIAATAIGVSKVIEKNKNDKKKKEVNDIMGALDDVAQKVKGKAQQVKGEIESKTGSDIDGIFDTVKGKVNETIADVKINARKELEKRSK